MTFFRPSWRVSSTVLEQLRCCRLMRVSLAGGRTELMRPSEPTTRLTTITTSSLSSRSTSSSSNTPKEPTDIPWDELEESLKKLSPSNPDPRDVVSSSLAKPTHKKQQQQQASGGYGDWDPSEQVVEKRSSLISNEPEVQLPIVHVKATYNNTMFTITDHSGRVLAWTSAGAEGFKNARKGTTFAAQSAAMAAAKKAQKLGFNKVAVKLKGPGPGRQSALKGLEMGAMKVVSIQDVTPIPHNGCKPRKAKRN